jgi:hypothetical protein
MRPSLSVVAANVQRLGDARKRLDLFTRFFRKSKARIFLLSEAGCRSHNEAVAWASECRSLAGNAIFEAGNQTAILWRPSPLLPHPPSRTNCYSSLLNCPARCMDAVFQLPDGPLHVVSVYAPLPVVKAVNAAKERGGDVKPVQPAVGVLVEAGLRGQSCR